MSRVFLLQLPVCALRVGLIQVLDDKGRLPMALRSMSLGVVLVALSGCASTAPTWSHSQLVGTEADRQFLIADGQCIREASTAVSVPQVSTPQAYTQQGYTVQGQAQTTTGTAPPTTTRYTAQVQPQFNVAQAMQSVQDAGTAGANRGAALNAQRRIYVGCMAAQGWLQAKSK